jgi:hypothetical protein
MERLGCVGDETRGLGGGANGEAGALEWWMAMAEEIAEERGGNVVCLQWLLLCPERKQDAHFIGSRH